MLIPLNAYELSYAEPGKAQLEDQLRLLTIQESLDTRTLATTRAVHRMYKGIPGVHSINDVGVTRLYVRLKCRLCGEILNSLNQSRYQKMKRTEPLPDHDFIVPAACPQSRAGKAARQKEPEKGDARETLRRMTLSNGM